jgi:hypothetical protein
LVLTLNSLNQGSTNFNLLSAGHLNVPLLVHLSSCFLSILNLRVVRMNRRWQKESVDRYRTLSSYGAFVDQVQKLEGSLGICDTADLYATYSVLHSKNRSPRLCVNRSPAFHYFLADVVVVTKTTELVVAGGEQP